MLSCVIISFALQQAVWGAPPTSYDEQNIKLRVILYALHQAVWGVPHDSCDEQNIKLRYYLFSIYIFVILGGSVASSDKQKH